MTDLHLITRLLLRHQSRIALARAANTVGTTTGIFFVIWALLFAAFSALPWIGLPILWDASVLALAILILALVAYHMVFRRPSRRLVARRLEHMREEKHQWLSLALELNAQRSTASVALIDSVLARASESLGSYPSRLEPIAKKQALLLLAVGVSLFSLCALLCRPSLLAYWDIPLQISRKSTVSLEPGTIALPKNSRCTLRCVPSQRIFPSSYLVVQELESPVRSRHLLRPDSTGAFSFTADSVRHSFTYAFSLGREVFGPETVTVVPPPRLHVLQVSLEPPRYTRRAPARLAEGKGSIAAFAGTRACFTIGSHFPLDSARFVPERGDTVALSVHGRTAKGTFTLWRSHRYSFALIDSLGQHSDTLPSFYIDILPDYPPAVRILKPGRNKDLVPAQLETLWIEGVDDLGIRRLACRYRKSSEPADSAVRWDVSPRKKAQPVVRVQAIWNLAELSLYPADTVYYWAEARDTKPFGVPQIATSDTFWFRVPSFEEIHEHLARSGADAEQTLEAVREHQNTMMEQLEQLMRSASEKKHLSWEEQKILEDLGQNFRTQVDSLSDAVESLKEAVDRMKQQESFSEEIIEKMDEVRRAVQELVEQYGDSLLFEPPKDGETMSWQDMKNAVEKMKRLLPDLQQHLDNALQYLEQLRRDQKLADLAARAEELADRQLQQASSRDTNAVGRQKQLSDDIDELTKDVGRLSSDTTGPAVRAEDIPSIDDIDTLQQAMQSRLHSNALPSQQQMTRMSGALQTLSEQLLSMLSTAMMAQMIKDRDLLLSLARDALDMATWQEDVGERRAEGQNGQLTAAQQQALIEALRKSMEKLDSLLSVPPSMLNGLMSDAEKALAAMGRALAAMPGGSAPGRSGQAKAQINNLASSLLASAEAMSQQCQGSCPSGMGGGLIPGLRKLSGKQAAINAATAELLRQLLGTSGSEGGMSMGRDSRKAAEAAQKAQDQIAEELKRLAEQYGKEAGAGAEKKMKELEEEARRLAHMLKNPRPEVGDRQERFLVRLLQTTLSMHKQDEGKEQRKSTSAKTAYADNRIAAPRADFIDADTFYRIRTRALEGNFPESYRQSIQAYFDSLGVLFLKN